MKAFGALVILCLLYQAHGWVNKEEMYCPPETEEGKDILYLDIYNCFYFYICDHGAPVHKKCPEGLEWNKKIFKCDYPSEANCTREVPPNSRTEGMDCPPENIEGKDVFHPDIHNCSCYYMCDHGAPVHKKCPKGLEWNKKLNICDYPEDAKCVDGRFRSRSLRVDIDCKPGVISYHPDPYDCTYYYQCVYGQLIRQPCPDGLHWNDKNKKCEWPENAKCKAISTPPTAPTHSTPVSTTISGPTTPYPTSCPAENPPGRDILLPNPYDCKSFYKCYRGEPILHYCPEGQEWADQFKWCDWPENAKCKAISTPPTAPTPSTPVSTTISGPTTPYPTSCPAENPPGRDILLPNPYDCKSFYKCYRGEPILHYCPEGQEWADQFKWCDWPENAKCKAISTPPTASTPSTTVSTTIPGPTTPYPTSCPAENPPGRDILLPNPYDCKSFYKCYRGEPILHYCPEGQEWADQFKWCDWPENAKCKAISTPPTAPTPSTPVSTTISGPTTPYPISCPAENPPGRDILLPNPYDCKSFYKCYRGEPILHYCPEGQEWADQFKWCDWPENAKCKAISTPPTASTPSAPTTPYPTSCPPENPPDHDILLPNPDDCKSFYKCDKGIPYLIPCPKGQEWADHLKRCDYPSIAKCSRSGWIRFSYM